MSETRPAPSSHVGMTNTWRPSVGTAKTHSGPTGPETNKAPPHWAKGPSVHSPKTRPRRITWDSGNSRVFWLLLHPTLPAFPENSPVARLGISSAVTAAGQRRFSTGFPNAVSVFLTIFPHLILPDETPGGQDLSPQGPPLKDRGDPMTPPETVMWLQSGALI